MHGTVFFHFHRYVEKGWGENAWPQLFAKAGIIEKSYSPVGVHPDEDILALVNAASEIAGMTSGEILASFGEYLAPELIALYPSLVDSDWRTLDLIANAERVIHNAVRAQNPDASPPVLRAQKINPHEVHLVYASPRMMCFLLKGIAKGVANYFGEEIKVIEESCMHEGSPFCSIVFKTNDDLLSDADTVALSCPASDSKLPQAEKSDTLSAHKGLKGPATSDSSFQAGSPAPRERRVGGYQIIDLLGLGGMGEVYLAQDIVLKRWVAIKMLPVEKSSIATRRRFLDEARTMASINHEHICPIYHVGDDGGTPYIVMPRLIGATLEDWMKEGNQPSLEHTLLIVLQTLSALEIVHKKRMLHRDIKPGNIWLEAPNGKVKLMDFGICLEIGNEDEPVARLTAADALVCTPLYMPPEALRGESDERSDLYSLGVVLYEMLTGIKPFAGKTTEDVFMKVATHIPSPPGEIVDNIPPCVDDFVTSLMANQPAKRPASASDTIEEVQRLIAQLKNNDACEA